MIKKLEVSKTYTEKQGELVTTFYYMAGKETGLSDGDTFIKLEFTHEKPFGVSAEKLHQHKTPLIYDNREFWTDERLQYVTPISKEEYMDFQNRKKEEKQNESHS